MKFDVSLHPNHSKQIDSTLKLYRFPRVYLYGPRESFVGCLALALVLWRFLIGLEKSDYLIGIFDTFIDFWIMSVIDQSTSLPAKNISFCLSYKKYVFVFTESFIVVE